MFAGKGAKIAPTINGQAEQQRQPSPRSRCRSRRARRSRSCTCTAPPPSLDAGVQFVNELKESDLLKAIPREIRKLIVNFATGQSFVGDVEILRGDLLDVVELKRRRPVQGHAEGRAFALDTFYGNVELPVDQVIGADQRRPVPPAAARRHHRRPDLRRQARRRRRSTCSFPAGRSRRSRCRRSRASATASARASRRSGRSTSRSC